MSTIEVERDAFERLQTLAARASAAEAECERLRGLVKIYRELAEDSIPYLGDYFHYKYGVDERLAEANALAGELSCNL